MNKKAFLIFLLIFFMCSCSSELTTFDVEGTVSFKGIPIPKGEIYFDPDPNVKGPQGRALIDKGFFSTKTQKAPIVAGKYNVRVHGFDGKPVQEAPFGRAIFPGYVTNMELQAGKFLTIEVPAK